MDVEARRAGAADLPELVRLVDGLRTELEPQRGGTVWRGQQARRDPIADHLAAQLDDDDRPLVVGVADGVVLGCASLHHEQLADGTLLGVIDELVVDPEARSIGLGEAILRWCVEWFDGRGCAGVDAFALPGARETKNFFESAGFTARMLVVHRRLGDDRS